MTAIKITAKRQATLPKKLCEEMKFQPGDTLIVDSLMVDGEKVWVIKPAADVETPWFGSLKRYAKGKRHDMKSIRRSIAEARCRGEL